MSVKILIIIFINQGLINIIGEIWRFTLKGNICHVTWKKWFCLSSEIITIQLGDVEKKLPINYILLVKKSIYKTGTISAVSSPPWWDCNYSHVRGDLRHWSASRKLESFPPAFAKSASVLFPARSLSKSLEEFTETNSLLKKWLAWKKQRSHSLLKSFSQQIEAVLDDEAWEETMPKNMFSQFTMVHLQCNFNNNWSLLSLCWNMDALQYDSDQRTFEKLCYQWGASMRKKEDRSFSRLFFGIVKE